MTQRRKLVLIATEVLMIALWAWQGWPWWALIPLLIAPPVALTVMDFVQVMAEMNGWIVPFTELIALIKSDEGNEIREDLLDSYMKGERNPTTLLALAAAHEYIGDGAQAQRYADEVYVLEYGDNLCRQHGIGARLKADALILARFDALVVLGHFVEAAQLMQNRLALSMQANFMTALAAWAYFLAEQPDPARAMLRRIKPQPRWFRMSRSISPRYLLLVAHMRHTLTGADQRTEVLAHLPAIIAWEDTARRHAASRYGNRLRAVIEDIKQLPV